MAPVGYFTIGNGFLNQWISTSSYWSLQKLAPNTHELPVLTGITIVPAYRPNSEIYHGDDMFGLDATGQVWKDAWQGSTGPNVTQPPVAIEGWALNETTIPGGFMAYQSVTGGTTANCHRGGTSDQFDNDCYAIFVESPMPNWTTTFCLNQGYCGTSEVCSSDGCTCPPGSYALYQRHHVGGTWAGVQGTQSSAAGAGSTYINTCVLSAASDSEGETLLVIDASGAFRSMIPGTMEGETTWDATAFTGLTSIAGHSSAAYAGVMVTTMQDPTTPSTSEMYILGNGIASPTSLNRVITPAECTMPQSVAFSYYTGDLYWLSAYSDGGQHDLCTWKFCEMMNAYECAATGTCSDSSHGYCSPFP